MSLEARLRRLEQRVQDFTPPVACLTCGFPRKVSPSFVATPDTYGTPCPTCDRPRDSDGLAYQHFPVIIVDPRPLAEIQSEER
jgi:hypothetical protein